MNKNINPAIIIGLGGTGQWVLTHLKNNLLERFEKIPPQIKMLSFDTTSEESEVYKKEKQEETQEEEVKVGPVKLIPGEEFIYLGGNVKKTCEQIANGQFSHISSWLQANNYLKTLSDDDFNLSRGAGQRRQFGRMALYLDLMAINANKVIGKISSALQSISRIQTRTQTVDVYLVSSIAGGTGSGMFIDIAHLVRVLSQREMQNAQVTVRGFLVLHNTFQSVIKVDQVKPQAYAAVRELNRFMTMFSEEYPINYSENQNVRELRTVYKSKLFDNCFLIDSDRNQSSLKEKPQHGVYPSVADCVTMMLDPSAGDTFQQHYKNVNNRIVEIQKRKPFGMYSSLGVFSYILPVEDMINACSLRFAGEFLNTYFVQRKMEENLSHEAYMSDLNTFFQQTAMQSGVLNSPFIQQISMLTNNPSLDDAALLKRIATKGGSISELFEPFGQTEETNKLKKKLLELTQIQLSREIASSKEHGDSYDVAVGRITSHASNIKNKIFGKGSDAKNGELHRFLSEMNNLVTAQYLLYLKDKILTTLNYDKKENRTNRLGYIFEFTKRALMILDRYSKLLEKVKSQKKVNVENDLKQARQRLEDSAKGQSIFDTIKRKLSSKSEEDYAQENYINSEQNAIEVEIEKVLFEEAVEITRNLIEITQSAMKEIENWMRIWSTGDKSANRLWVERIIIDRREALKQQRNEKELIKVRQYLTDDKYEDNLYKRIAENKAEDFASRFIWEFKTVDGEVKLNLSLDQKNLPADFNDTDTVYFNFQQVMDAIRPYFEDVKREKVASRMEALYPSERISKEMVNLSAPLLNVRREDEAALEQETKIFISVDKAPAIGYMSGLESDLQNKVNSKNDALMIDSADPYRCVVISTQDLIGIDAIQSISDARHAYDNQVNDQKQKLQLHVFPAEIHAVEYEKRLGEHPFYYFKKKPHQFSNKVVMLMEDLDRFELFMLAYALGVIQIEDSPEHRRLQYYVLRLQREQKFDQAFWIPLSQPDAKPSLFEAMHTFVFQKPNKPGLDASQLISSRDGDRFVDKARVERAINQYEESIQWGLDYQIRPFSRFLGNLRWPDSMQSMIPVLESEFRYFLMDNTTIKNKSVDVARIQADAQKWLSNMRDLNIQYHQEIVDKASELTFQARSLMQDSKDVGRLRRHLEEYVILEKVPELINSKRIEERDLGIMMHMIVWDYIQRLETQ